MKTLKLFRQESLIISKKTIVSKNSFIQIGNITRVWYGRPEVDIPVFKLLLGLVGGVAVENTPFKSLGIIIIMLTFGIIGYYVYLLNNYTLNFELSSGQVYAFTTLRREFLEKSYEKVKQIMDGKNNDKENYEINFNSCKIQIIKDNKEVITGDNAIVTKGNNNSININQTDNNKNVNHTHIKNSYNTSNTTNYELLRDELNIISEMPEIQKNEKDLELIKQARVLLEQKDDTGFKLVLRKLSTSTIKIIESTSSLITIADFLTKFVFK
jgi:hypothetical protein